MYIVQCKPPKSEGIRKVNTTTRNMALEAANDFLNRGMQFVTIAADGCVYTAEELATLRVPGVRERKSSAEDTIGSVVDDLLEGQYKNPVRVIGFNTAERSSFDVSYDVAQELRKRCADQQRELPDYLQQFVERTCNQ